MKGINKKLISLGVIFLAVIFCVSFVFAGTTGKIHGKVTDSASGEPLVGANVVVEGTTLGAAADDQGEFFILQIPPGVYTLRASMIGYEQMAKVDIIVRVDLTSEVDFPLNETAIVGEEVTVTAERPIIQRDETSTKRVMASEDIEEMPVFDLWEAVQTQPGVFGDHFRGSRDDQAMIMLDGTQLGGGSQRLSYRGSWWGAAPQLAYDKAPVTSISPRAVQQLEVITGGFNAEYGNAQGGIINVVLKEGSASRYHGSIRVNTRIPLKRHFGPDIYKESPVYKHWSQVSNWEEAWVGDGKTPLWQVWSDVLSKKKYPSLLAPEMEKYENLIGPLPPVDGGFTLNNATEARDFFLKLNPVVEYYQNWDKNIELNLGGPVPFSDKATFFISGIIDNEYDPFPTSTTPASGFLGATNFRMDYDGREVKEGDPEWGESYLYHNIDTDKYYIDKIYVVGEDKKSGDWTVSLLGNLAYRFTPNMKLRVGGYYYYDIEGHGGSREGGTPSRDMYTSWKWWFNWGMINKTKTYRINVDWSHTLSSKTYYEIQFRYESSHRGGTLNNGISYTDSWERSNIYGYNGELNPDGTYGEFDPRSNTWNDICAALGRKEIYPWGDFGNAPNKKENRNNHSESGGYGFNSGRWRVNAWWPNQNSMSWSLYGYIDSQIHRHHEVKAGFRFDYDRVSDTDYWSNGNPKYHSRHISEGHPVNVGAYLQDKMEYEGIIVNAGVRADVFMPRKEYYTRYFGPWRNPNYPDDPNAMQFDPFSTPTADATNKWMISPRLGISHPITEKMVLHFQYGHFYQVPDIGALYTQNWLCNMDDGIHANYLSSPNLEPEKTVAYELGAQYNLLDMFTISATAYYKDITDQLEQKEIQGIYFEDDYRIPINGDWATNRGIELEVRKWYSHNISGRVSYTYSFAKGSASDPKSRGWSTDFEDERFQQTLPVTSSAYMDHDRRHRIVANVIYKTREGYGPGIGKLIKPLSDLQINVIYRATSGRPFTYTGVGSGYNPDDVAALVQNISNNWRSNWTMKTDVRIVKRFKLVRGLRQSVFLEIRNLFNRKNYQGSGEAWVNRDNPDYDHGEFGWHSNTNRYGEDFAATRYTEPRQYYVGTQIEW